jgi:hypothetical protein
MAGLGVTHDGLATRLAAVKSVNGWRVRYLKSKGVTTSPAAHAVSG